MNDHINPVIPAGANLGWTLFAVALVVLLVSAVISIVLRTRGVAPAGADSSAQRSAAGARLAWLAVVILAPVLGPILWFGIGRRLTGSLPRP